jgi:mono/diheme cytochrome c family protein
MKAAALLLVAVLLAGAGIQSGARGDKPRPGPAPQPLDPALVKRGEYLVNQVARCGDCHTPRDDRGRLDPNRHLQGAAMWFTPKVRIGEWEDRAPDITRSGKAGKWTEERMVRLLTGGKESDPPMPAYKLEPADARAVAAYLRSLPGRKGRDAREREDDD